VNERFLRRTLVGYFVVDLALDLGGPVLDGFALADDESIPWRLLCKRCSSSARSIAGEHQARSTVPYGQGDGAALLLTGSAIHFTVESGSERERPSADLVAAWCKRWLGVEPTDVLFHQGHLSEVIGLRVADGSAVVLKLRPPSGRLAACFRVQRHLWAAGFPCPEPLAGPAPLGTLSATAETLIEGGAYLPATDESPRLFAQSLVRLVSLAPNVASLPTLEPSLPWVGWDHDEKGTWPVPDDIEADLNAHVGPEWIEDAGARVRRRLLQPSSLPMVVGHADWESQNLRWVDRQLHVVHDWDSIVGQREAPIAGAASAVFTATGEPDTSATVEQSEAFLVAYAQGRGRQWTEEELELAWAAGLWVRVFNAKKATLRPGGETPSPSRLRLKAEVGERLRRAGA
jgi:hypothetical protein